MNSQKDTALKVFKKVQKGTEFVLMAIPSDKLDHSVAEETAKIGELAFHIATLPLGSTLFAQGLYDKFPPSDILLAKFEEFLGDTMEKKDYYNMFKKSCTVFLDYFEGKTDEEWNNDTYSTFLTRGPISYLEGVLNMQNHLLQHRGSLFSTLKSLGINVSMMQYFGMKPYEK